MLNALRLLNLEEYYNKGSDKDKVACEELFVAALKFVITQLPPSILTKKVALTPNVDGWAELPLDFLNFPLKVGFRYETRLNSNGGIDVWISSAREIEYIYLPIHLDSLQQPIIEYIQWRFLLNMKDRGPAFEEKTPSIAAGSQLAVEAFNNLLKSDIILKSEYDNLYPNWGSF